MMRRVELSERRQRWEINTKFWSKNLKGREAVDWIHVSQVRDQWPAVVKTVMNFRVP